LLGLITTEQSAASAEAALPQTNQGLLFHGGVNRPAKSYVFWSGASSLSGVTLAKARAAVHAAGKPA
jgi:hypothetical protein